jgi:hypothetical protein
LKEDRPLKETTIKSQQEQKTANNWKGQRSAPQGNSQKQFFLK